MHAMPPADAPHTKRVAGDSENPCPLTTFVTASYAAKLSAEYGNR
jgi:hypothetical protein